VSQSHANGWERKSCWLAVVAAWEPIVAGTVSEHGTSCAACKEYSYCEMCIKLVSRERCVKFLTAVIIKVTSSGM
jgi:hypothetical protein